MITKILSAIPGRNKNAEEAEIPKPKKKKIWLEDPIVGKTPENKNKDLNADTN